MFGYTEYTSETPFETYALHVLEVKDFQGVKHRTLAGYKNILHMLSPDIGDTEIGSITPQLLNALYVRMYNGGEKSTKTIQNRKIFISSVLQQAVREQILPYNAAKLSSPPKLVQGKANYFTSDETKAMKRAIADESPKWQTVFYLLLCTGVRRGELCGLKWSDVNFGENSVKICRSVLYTPEKGIFVDTPKTESSYRTISVPEQITRMLKQYRTWVTENTPFGANGFLFCGKDGVHPMHPDSVTRFFSRFAQKNNFPNINPHAFRHTMASALIADGVDIVSVSKRLGHKKVSTTVDIYSHVVTRLDTVCSDSIAKTLL